MFLTCKKTNSDQVQFLIIDREVVLVVLSSTVSEVESIFPYKTFWSRSSGMKTALACVYNCSCTCNVLAFLSSGVVKQHIPMLIFILFCIQPPPNPLYCAATHKNIPNHLERIMNSSVPITRWMQLNQHNS